MSWYKTVESVSMTVKLCQFLFESIIEMFFLVPKGERKTVQIKVDLLHRHEKNILFIIELYHARGATQLKIK